MICGIISFNIKISYLVEILVLIFWTSKSLAIEPVTRDKVSPVHGIGVAGWGLKSDQPPGSYFTLSCAGNNRDPGGG